MRFGIRGKILLFALFAWAFIFGIYGIHVYRERTAQTERMAVATASLLAREIQTERQIYSSTVVKRALDAGMTVTDRYHNLERSIPAPSTFVKEVAAVIGSKDGFNIELKGSYPVNPQNSPSDPFEREALAFFSKGIESRFYRFEDVGGKRSLRYMVSDSATSQACVDCHNSIPGGPPRGYKIGDVMGAIEITLPVESESAVALADVWRSIGYGFAVIVVIAAIGLAFIGRLVTGPVVNLVDVTGQLASGDLTLKAPVRSDDEIGDLSSKINEVAENLHAMIEEIRGSTDEAVEISGRVREMMRSVLEGSGRQGSSIDELVMNMEKAGSSIAEATGAAESLEASVQAGSSSLLDLGASVNEAAENTETLFDSVDETVRNTSGLSDSVKEMSGTIEDLSSAVAQVSSSMVRINARIKEIEVRATEARKYSEDCIKDANAGKEAVASTVGAVLKVKEMAKDSTLIITSLCEKVKEIGKTLGFIRDVAEETNLLAINAAITAAQSGEDGKGFAVVANEIKDLAERTSALAKDVSEIIEVVETESGKAAEAMEKGVEGVEKGVGLAVAAGDGLKKIVESAERSAQSVREIARSSVEQARESQSAATGMNALSEETRKIVSASQEHLRGSELIGKTSERMAEMAHRVKGSTKAGAAASMEITRIMEEASRLSAHINAVMREQKRNIERVIGALSAVRHVSSENMTRTSEAERAVEDMVRLNNELIDHVKRFKLRR